MAGRIFLKRAWRVALPALALVAPTMAAAQMTDAQRFPDFLRSAEYRTLATRYFNEEEPGPLHAKCPVLSVVAWGDPIVVVPAKFQKNGDRYSLTAGRWVQPATLNRCGAKVMRRTLLTQDGGILHGGALLPGAFRGNLQLEDSAEHIVLPAAMGTAKCEDYKTLWVLDTKLTSPAKAQGWSETWTMQACGRAVTADVVYTADATGMNITAKNVKLH
jgi:hypothetical protein